jgi:hypothetical protein
MQHSALQCYKANNTIPMMKVNLRPSRSALVWKLIKAPTLGSVCALTGRLSQSYSSPTVSCHLEAWMVWWVDTRMLGSYASIRATDRTNVRNGPRTRHKGSRCTGSQYTGSQYTGSWRSSHYISALFPCDRFSLSSLTRPSCNILGYCFDSLHSTRDRWDNYGKLIVRFNLTVCLTNMDT